MYLLYMYMSPLHLDIRLPPINALIRIFNPPLSLILAFTITLTLTLTLKASSGGDARRMEPLTRHHPPSDPAAAFSCVSLGSGFYHDGGETTLNLIRSTGLNDIIILICVRL